MGDSRPASSEDRDEAEPVDGDADSAAAAPVEDADATAPDPASDADATAAGQADDATTDAPDAVSEAELLEQVEAKYDFDDFGPADMAEMSQEEWEVAFDADSWITGDELLDRVRQDLEASIASREVFAVLEDIEKDGRRCLLAFSDEDYALVYPDGTVEGFGTVLRDVKPVVALCSMDGYEPSDAPENVVLPEPSTVPEGSGELGNWMLQAIAAVQLVAGLGLLVGAVFASPPGVDQNIGSALMVVLGSGFVLVALLLFTVVANARLSDKFRAEEYRERLRGVGLEDGERPDFLPLPDDAIDPQDGGDQPDSR
jgi:hypothetical protein